MPNLPIDGLPASSGSTTSDPFPTVQGGVTKKITWAQMLADATGATITSSTINSTTIGATTPSSGVFSSLAYQDSNVNITTTGSIPTTGSLSKVYNVSGSGITLTFAAIAGYAAGFNITFVNVDTTHSFTLASSDLIAGQSSIVVPPYGAVTVEKNFAGTSWNIVSDNSTQTGAYFQIANNLSESTSISTLRNNIGIAEGFVNLATSTTLTNPCPNIIYAAPLSGFDINVTFPVMNSTTPGSKSPDVGSIFIVANISSPSTGGNIFCKFNDGSAIGGSIKPGDWAILMLVNNGSSNGNIVQFTFGSAYQMPASDLTNTTILSGALNPSISWVGNMATYADSNGSLTNGGYPYTAGYQAITTPGTTALTNPQPTFIITTPSTGNDITVKMAPSNVNNSVKKGQPIIILHGGSSGNLTLQYQDGSALGVPTLHAGQWVILELEDNSTANGTYGFLKFGTAYQMNASDTTSTTLLAGALNPNVSWDGKLAQFSGSNGSLTTSTFAPAGLPVTPYMVGPSCTYTTIQSAINQAHTDGASNTSIKVVYVQPGSYTENLTMYDGIFVTGLSPVNPMLGLFNPLGSGAGFNSDNQNCGVILVGSITSDVSALTHDSMMGVQNISINPTTGGAISFTGDITATYSSVLNLFGCKVQVNQSSNYIFTMHGGYISANNCFVMDNTSDQTGHLLSVNTDGVASFLLFDNSAVYTDFGATACTFGTGTAPVLRFSNSILSCSFDATNAASYFFRAWFTTHYNDNPPVTPLPYHVTGASTTGRIVYEKCNVQQDVNTNVATIGNSAFEYQDDNTGYGTLGFGSSSYTVSGGDQTRNCFFRSATASFFKLLDTIRVGYAGAGQFTSQAGVHTTDATVTTLASVVVNQLESITLKGTITAAQSDHTNAVGGDFTITARRASGGNITLVGNPVVNVNSSSAATFTCDVDTGTQSVRIRVTGVAATTYNWVTTYSYQKVLTNS